MLEAKIIKDSYSIVNGCNCRITTAVVILPRTLLAQFNKHREFSSNTTSSRAKPTKGLIETVKNNPYFPKFQKNKAGMQSSEDYTEVEYNEVKRAFEQLKETTVYKVEEIYDKYKPHKQEINRLLEPYLTCEILLTSTSFSNFFGLRTHKDTQDGFSQVAKLLVEAYENSTPKLLESYEWHLPMILEEEIPSLYDIKYSDVLLRLKSFDLEKGTNLMESYTRERFEEFLLQDISAGRCTTISYTSLLTGKFDPIDDIRRSVGLSYSTPIHASPFEHMARPARLDEMKYTLDQLAIQSGKILPLLGQVGFVGNLKGFTQYRKLMKNEYIYEFQKTY